MQGCFAGQARIVGLAGKPVLSTREGNVSRGGGGHSAEGGEYCAFEISV